MRVLIALALAASLAACGTLTGGPIIPPSAVVTSLKVEYGFELIYNTAAKAYLAAAPKLSVARKAQLKPLLAKAFAATVAAQAAETLGQADTVVAQVNALEALAAQITALLAKS